MIVKHANPCGAAQARTLGEAYEGALACDPLSAYGGVVAFDRPVDGGLGAGLAEQFVEVVFAPGYDEDALAGAPAKPNARILSGSDESAEGLAFRAVPGGLLVQERDLGLDETIEVVCGEATDEQCRDLYFAGRVCKHVTSNAIVLARNQATIGIGAGQQSRVDAVRLAIEKARERGHDVRGSVLASDAFFPFPDGPELALEAGVAAIVQPGGSKRDDEVIEAVRSAGGVMVFTGRRHFRH